MAWKKGQSGNPTGRNGHVHSSAELALRAAAQKWGLKGVQIAAGIMIDEDVDPRTRLAAVELLHNRGYGKPIQPHANPDLSPLNWGDMGTEDLMSALRRIEMSINNVPEASTITSEPDPLGKMQ